MQVAACSCLHLRQAFTVVGVSAATVTAAAAGTSTKVTAVVVLVLFTSKCFLLLLFWVREC